MTWLLVALGGAIGATARHAVNVTAQARFGTAGFPVGILLVNVLGCLAAGMLAGLITSTRGPISAEARTFAMVGVLGGFTTFSAFGVDTFVLLQGGHHLTAALNVVAHIALTLLAVWAGFVLVR